MFGETKMTMASNYNVKEHVSNLKNAFITAYKSENAQVRHYASLLANSADVKEFQRIQHEINTAHNNGNLSMNELAILEDLGTNLWHGFIWREPQYTNSDLVKTFIARIWKVRHFASIIQLRNAISDMFLLKFLTPNEYIQLNNEIDDFLSFLFENNFCVFFDTAR